VDSGFSTFQSKFEGWIRILLSWKTCQHEVATIIHFHTSTHAHTLYLPLSEARTHFHTDTNTHTSKRDHTAKQFPESWYSRKAKGQKSDRDHCFKCLYNVYGGTYHACVNRNLPAQTWYVVKKSSVMGKNWSHLIKTLSFLGFLKSDIRVIFVCIFLSPKFRVKLRMSNSTSIIR